MNPEIWFPNLGIKIQHLSRVLATVFGVDIYWYGVIMVTAIYSGLLYAAHEAKRTGQDPDLYYDFIVYGIIGSIIGARLYYVAFSWDSYKDNLIKIFAMREGGIAVYGSLIGGFITLFVFTRLKKLNFWLFADSFAPGFTLGQIIGRWGNFFNREAFGGYTENLFAMRYLKDTVPYIPHSVLERVITVNGAQYIQVHPTFLYECFWNIMTFIILFLLRDKKRFDGEIIAQYFILYGAGRLWIEGLRTDQLIIGNTGIAISQVMSALLIILSLTLIVTIRKRLAAKREVGE